MKFDVKQGDPILAVTWFLEMRDGEVIRPKLYRYGTQEVLIGFRKVEERSRISQTTSTKHKPYIYLPYADDIRAYLLLIRGPLPTGEVKDGKPVYEKTPWRLVRISAKDVAPDKPIVFPALKELLDRELSDEDQKLEKNLVARYEKIAAEARKRRNTPVPPRGVGAKPVEEEASNPTGADSKASVGPSEPPNPETPN